MTPTQEQELDSIINELIRAIESRNQSQIMTEMLGGFDLEDYIEKIDGPAEAIKKLKEFVRKVADT